MTEAEKKDSDDRLNAIYDKGMSFLSTVQTMFPEIRISVLVRMETDILTEPEFPRLSVGYVSKEGS